MKTNAEALERARESFYSQNLTETYTILRRFFDRLPFKPQKEHAEYIGIFLRTLVELGKQNELQFYVNLLERQNELLSSPEIKYQLGMVYFYLNNQSTKARDIFDSLIREESDGEYSIKARMMLISFYYEAKDYGACRAIIDSIKPQNDPTLFGLWEIWRTLILLAEDNTEAAMNVIRNLIDTLSKESNWYVYYSARITEAKVHLKRGEVQECRGIINSLKSKVDKNKFKSLSFQLNELEGALNKKASIGEAYFAESQNGATLSYETKTLNISQGTSVEKLLLLLFTEKWVPKQEIVKKIYHREYKGETDDQLIYSHIHAARKRLQSIGLPSSAIANENNGYRFTPNLVKLRGNT